MNKQNKIVFAIILGRLLLETLDDFNDKILFTQDVKNSIKNCILKLEKVYNKFFNKDKESAELSDSMANAEELILKMYKIILHFEKVPILQEYFQNEFDILLKKYKIEL